MLVYGFLVAIGSNEPKISDDLVFIIAVILFIFCILWSTIIWLHEQGLEFEASRLPKKPDTEESIVKAAADMPKL